jgi:hypothetical protein
MGSAPCYFDFLTPLLSFSALAMAASFALSSLVTVFYTAPLFYKAAWMAAFLSSSVSSFWSPASACFDSSAALAFFFSFFFLFFEEPSPAGSAFFASSWGLLA